MSVSPRVSVCVSAFNAGRYLAETLESLQAQSFEDFEVIVVDDGSSDNTPRIAEEFAANDDRFRLTRNERNRGLVFTRNRALAESRGEFVAIADADDLSERERFAVQVAYLDAHHEIGMVGSDVTLVDERGECIGAHSQQYERTHHIRFFLMFGPCVHNPTTMYRRDVLAKLGGYAQGFDAGAEDYELWGRVSAVTGIANIPRPLVQYRKHSGSVTADRTRVDANIFAISAGLIGSYLNRTVGDDDARLLHAWLIRQGIKPAEARDALLLAKSIWECASAREPSDTLALLGDLFSAAAWSHAQYMVYADRELSLDLARFAVRLPHSSPQAGRISYAGRLAMPSAIRSLLKSITRPS